MAESGKQMDERSSGVLMHVISLPGRHGSGDLGQGAYDFVDFLAAAGQSWWQVLPHNPPGDAPGYSPYSAPSTFAGNPWFVSPESLVEQGFLDRSDIRPPSGMRDDRVLFGKSIVWRDRVMRQAYANIRKKLPKQLLRYKMGHAFWLEDWGLYAALRQKFGGKSWVNWPAEIRAYEPEAVAEYHEKLHDEVMYHQFVQWQFHLQWRKLKLYAKKNGVGLIGDLPIFVGHDSADVWGNQRRFKLNAKGYPRVVSGCPADGFNVNGQVWNHPHYDWPVHLREGFKWWISRFFETLKLFDVVRVDHFLGFYRLWEIPFGAATGLKGKWSMTPGHQLFMAMKKALGNVPVIAEDLGTVTQGAIDLRDEFDFPGMHVLMFGCEPGGDHLPDKFRKRSTAYTGTHDCDTTNGFVRAYQKVARKDAHARGYLERFKLLTGHEISNPAHDLIRILMTSIADTAIVPVQDILGLGSEGRMNLPGTEGNNWHWRMKPGALTDKHAKWLKDLVELTHRNTK